MRARLTASFVVLSVVLLVGACGVRGYTEQSMLRPTRAAHLRAGGHDARAGGRAASGSSAQPVDRAFLAGVVDGADRLEYDAGGRPSRSSSRARPTSDDDPRRRHRDRWSTRRRHAHPASGRRRCSTTWSAATSARSASWSCWSALVAALVGYVIAGLLSAPFQQLAGAAGQLGRAASTSTCPGPGCRRPGRSARRCCISAGQLQERLASEQATSPSTPRTCCVPP